MNRLIFSLLVSLGSLSCLQAQSFIFNQFFQPSIRLNAEYADGGLAWSEAARMPTFRSNVNLILPVKSKLGVKLDWAELIRARPWRLKNLTRLKIDKVAKVKMYQIFWNLRPQYSQVQYLGQANDSFGMAWGNNARKLYGLSTGITGLHLLNPVSKGQMLFYSVNAGFQEEQNNLKRLEPSATAAIGVINFSRLIFYWYYGLYMSYSNGQFLPVPFLGVEAKASKNFSINITLPVQLRLGWKLGRKGRLDLVGGLAGWSGGLLGPQLDTRYRMSDVRVKGSATLSFKLSSQSKLYFEGGYLGLRRFQMRVAGQDALAPNLGQGWFGGFSLFYAFRKSLLSETIDGLITF